jgi:hypothetical protein
MDGNWKDIVKEEDKAFNVRFVPLLLMDWEAPMLNVMLEFMNTFLIKGTNLLWA